MPSDKNLLQVIKPDGSVHKDRDPSLPDKTLVQMYETMYRTRALNERGMNLQRQGRINFYIGSEGQEAIPTGVAASMKTEDWYFPHYRDLAVALYRGATIGDMVHQLYGSAKDIIQGKQMPNHFSFKNINFFSISSPLTTQVPQAVGAAYAQKLRGEKNVTAVGFGDGSTSEGDFHVGLNFAAVWKTPVVFICNNNQWAISVPSKLQSASETYAQKADAYGMPSIRVDGNDILAVYLANLEAVNRAREGGGPTLIEAVTFRMGPHSSSDDPKRYVPPAQYEEWKKKDPILRMRKYLENKGIWDDKREDELAERTKAEIQAAVEDVEKTPEPALRTMFEGVFEEMPWHLEEQYRDLKRIVGDDENREEE